MGCDADQAVPGSGKSVSNLDRIEKEALNNENTQWSSNTVLQLIYRIREAEKIYETLATKAENIARGKGERGIHEQAVWWNHVADWLREAKDE